MIAEKLHAVNWRNNKKSWFLKLNSPIFKDKIQKTGNNEHFLNEWGLEARGRTDKGLNNCIIWSYDRVNNGEPFPEIPLDLSEPVKILSRKVSGFVEYFRRYFHFWAIFLSAVGKPLHPGMTQKIKDFRGRQAATNVLYYEKV